MGPHPPRDPHYIRDWIGGCLVILLGTGLALMVLGVAIMATVGMVQALTKLVIPGVC